jgi:ferredoxin-type protein NapH
VTGVRAGGAAGGPRWTRRRRAVQALFAALYLVLPFLGAERLAGTMVALRVGPVDLVEPASAASAWLAGGAAAGVLLAGVVPVALLAALLGPVYCSWACPYGLLSEGIDRLRSGRARWPDRSWERVRLPRLLSLSALLGGSLLLGAPLAAILAPPRLATALPLEAVSARVVPVVTGALLLAALALEALGPRRILCRALCPAGGLAAWLRLPFAWRPRFDEARCLCPDVARCHQHCPWGIDPRRMRRADGCTSCMACVDGCPSGALLALRRGPARHRGG